MPSISKTTFVDFVAKSGTPKLTVVKVCKKQIHDKYDPKTDFYKKIRDGIVRYHKSGAAKSSLDALAKGVSDRNKLKLYPEIVKAYKKFLGRKTVKWFDPKKSKWNSGRLEVSVNPELGLEIDGTRYLVKLYFKSEPIKKNQFETILYLMKSELAPGDGDPRVAVLDVRNGKLHSRNVSDPLMQALVEGEAASFSSMYSRI